MAESQAEHGREYHQMLKDRGITHLPQKDADELLNLVEAMENQTVEPRPDPALETVTPISSASLRPSGHYPSYNPDGTEILVMCGGVAEPYLVDPSPKT